MFSRRSQFLRCIWQFSSARTNTTLAPEPAVHGWIINCNICLERKPVICRRPTELELKFMKMLKETENEKSMKSEIELRHEADMRRAADLQKGKISSEDLDKASGKTAAEIEDTGKKELEEFPFAPFITEDDEKNNTKSTDRQLDRNLVYVIKENIGGTDTWVLPNGSLHEDESLREAAERILRNKYGKKVRAKYLGNAPFGFYKYNFSKAVKEETGKQGMQMFFMKAQYLGGDVGEDVLRLDYTWATRKELRGLMKHSYHKAVSSVLIDEEH